MPKEKEHGESELENSTGNGTLPALTVALEELQLLQTIIGNHETLFDKIRGWCMTLIGAISVAYISKEIEIEAIPYVILSWFIIAFFAFTEAVHRVAHGRAMNRSEEVEAALVKRGAGYDGPKIRKSLKIGIDLASLKEFSHKLRFWVVWGSLLVSVLIISMFGSTPGQ